MTPDPSAWLDARLAGAGRRRTGDLELVRQRPWGTVWAAPTDRGRVWVKRPGPDNEVEVPLLGRLAGLDAPLLPEVLGAGDGLLALADAGRPFREVFTGDAAVTPFTAAVVALGAVQRSAVRLVPGLLALGLADLRPAALPARFDDLHAVLGDVAGARTTAAARAGLVDVCAGLAASGLAASVDHNDLHGGNLLVDRDGRLTAVDWGDSAVAHPFTTLHVPSRALAAAAGADPEHAWDVPAVAAARRAYLAGFAAVAPGEDLDRTARLAFTTAGVVRTWIWHRAVTSAARTPGRAGDLREFTEQTRTWWGRAVSELAGRDPGKSVVPGQ